MIVTVCELTNDPTGFVGEWERLCAHVSDHGSRLVLLPEMPFSPWLSAEPVMVPERWAESVADHSRWIDRLHELGAETVVSTRPVVEDGEHFNQGFVWERSSGEARAVHKKRYLPNEAGFWEATWYSPGDREFPPFPAAGATAGIAICTEIWFHRHARDFAREGVQLLLSPRATLLPSRDKWVAGGRAAAVVSGAYCLSSNFGGPHHGLPDWGGAGWIIEPEEGEVLGVTSRENPFLTLEIDLAVADNAKFTYPRYVVE